MAMSFEMIILGRFLVGISAGLGISLSPMYLSEISPVHLRGAVSNNITLINCFFLLYRVIGKGVCDFEAK